MTNSSKSDKEPNVAVIIPNWNGMKWLPDCLRHLNQQSYTSYQVLMVDNASEDGSCEWVHKHYPETRIISLSENLGFAKAVNEGIRQTDTPYFALLNTDTRVDPDWLHYLVSKMQDANDDLGAVSPLMLSLTNPDMIDDAGDSFSWYGFATKVGHGSKRDSAKISPDIFSPSGGASLYRRSYVETCGLFDEVFFAYLEDVDLGLRGRLLGYHYELESKSVVYHQGHGSQMNRDLYLKLITQNRLLIFLKNIPLKLLLKNVGRIIYGQIYFLVANGKFIPVLRGYISFLTKIPHGLRMRRKYQPRITLSDKVIYNLLSDESPGDIFAHIKKIWKRGPTNPDRKSN